jgi:hypothetical protein
MDHIPHEIHEAGEFGRDESNKIIEKTLPPEMRAKDPNV